MYYNPQELSAAMLRQETRAHARGGATTHANGAKAAQQMTFADVWQVEHKAAQIWNSKLGKVTAERKQAPLPAPFTTTDELARGYPPIENVDLRGVYSPYVWREGVTTPR